MPTYFVLSFRFLDPVPSFHGRGDGGEPEWPPSPLRGVQALVCAAAKRWPQAQFSDRVIPALHWLENCSAPNVIAPVVQCNRTPYRMFVPNNAGDLVTAAWGRGLTDASMAQHRVEKDVRPSRLIGGDTVYYLFPLDNDTCPHIETLTAAARSITHLGWGIDMVAANAAVLSEAEAMTLPGERWRAVPSGGTPLRVPISGTLDALLEKHLAFLRRLGADGFHPVPPLGAFRVVGYRRDSVPAPRPFVAFKLIRPDADGMAYFPATRAVTVAGMVRHAVAEAATASGWDRAKINQFVLGHREKPEDTLPRFAYVPLPSIEPSPRNVVGGIRRVLLAEPLDAAGENIGWARRLLPGQVVTNDAGQPVAYLEHIPQEGIDGRYVRRAQTWTSVSPVALPGCDEGKASKTDKLLEKMFRHAGYRIEDVEELEFHRVPFLRGTEDAKRYCPGPPHYLAHCTMYHMRIRWKRPTPGPLALGSGRFCGLGLFAAIS